MKIRVAVLALVVLSLVVPSLSVRAAWTQVDAKLLSGSASDEIEPALISHTVSGIEYHSSVWMSFTPDINANSTLKFAAWTTGGATTVGDIPTVAPYTKYADPILVKPPTQNRFYLVGLGINVRSADEIDYGIIVWTSTNWGVNWSAGHVIASSTRNTRVSPSTGYRFDKPVATTGTDNRLWVAYVRSQALDTIQVQGGTASGTSPITWSWTPAYQAVGTSETPGAPQIMTDNTSGQTEVFLLYKGRVSNGPTSIHFRRAVESGGLTFGAPTTIAGVGTLTTSEVNLTPGVTPSVRIRTVVVPMAKLDRWNKRIVVAWHEVNPAGGMRVKFAAHSLNSNPSSTITLAEGAGANHVNTGLEIEPFGTRVMVTWYGFGANSTRYRAKASLVTFTNNITPVAGAVQDVNSREGDASKLRPDSNQLRHIGEYHDVTFVNSTFSSAHIMADATSPSDVWVFRFRP